MLGISSFIVFIYVESNIIPISTYFRGNGIVVLIRITAINVTEKLSLNKGQ